jgi:NDP-sugar pyrophosphorylase family protein
MYALIIAGGEGERLRPLTNDRPKAMVPVAGKPIIEHQLAWLRTSGITDVVLLCGYRASAVQEHLGDGSRFGLRTYYSLEDEPLGRGGALKRGFLLVPGDQETIVALNGDILTNQPLAELLSYHRRKQAVATVMLSPLRSPYGIARVARDGRIESFEEKPQLPYWVNSGIYAFSREFFSLLPEKGDHEDTTFPRLAAEGKLYGFRSKAYWRPVDSIKDLGLAERELAQMALSG